LTLSRLVPGKSEEDREKPQDNRWPISFSNLSFTRLIFIILINSKHKQNNKELIAHFAINLLQLVYIGRLRHIQYDRFSSVISLFRQ
jgi:hypothetical protein